MGAEYFSQKASGKVDYQQIYDAARRWHHDECISLADAAIAACNEGSAADDSDETRRERMTEWLDETLDGHEHVIYTGQAQLVILASNNDDAYEDVLDGREPVSESQRAYFALQADVWEMLGRREDEWLSPDEDKAVADVG